jgi:hypothetical protein
MAMPEMTAIVRLADFASRDPILPTPVKPSFKQNPDLPPNIRTRSAEKALIAQEQWTADFEKQ